MIMAKVTLDMSLEEIKNILFQLPPRDFMELYEAFEERAGTISMMKLAETGFREWLEEGEDIYDVEA